MADAKNLSTALVAAIAEIGNPTKNKVNPHFKNHYADLASVLEMISGPLAKHGLAVLQEVTSDVDNGNMMLTTTLMHSGGETRDCGNYALAPTKRDPQGYGSAITYARRYSLMALFGMAAEDDDGSAASRPAAQPAARRQSKPQADYGEINEMDVGTLIATAQERKTVEDLTALWAKYHGCLKAAELKQVKEAFGERRRELEEDLSRAAEGSK